MMTCEKNRNGDMTRAAAIRAAIVVRDGRPFFPLDCYIQAEDAGWPHGSTSVDEFLAKREIEIPSDEEIAKWL